MIKSIRKNVMRQKLDDQFDLEGGGLNDSFEN